MVLGLLIVVIGIFVAWGGLTGRLPGMINALGSGRKKQALGPVN